MNRIHRTSETSLTMEYYYYYYDCCRSNGERKQSAREKKSLNERYVHASSLPTATTTTTMRADKKITSTDFFDGNIFSRIYMKFTWSLAFFFLFPTIQFIFQNFHYFPTYLHFSSNFVTVSTQRINTRYTHYTQHNALEFLFALILTLIFLFFPIKPNENEMKIKSIFRFLCFKFWNYVICWHNKICKFRLCESDAIAVAVDTVMSNVLVWCVGQTHAHAHTQTGTLCRRCRASFSFVHLTFIFRSFLSSMP